MSVLLTPSFHFSTFSQHKDASLFSVFSSSIFDTFDKERLEHLFKNGANVNEIEEKSGMNFLQKCIVEFFFQDDVSEILELLILEGIDLDHQDLNNCTALQLAIEYQQLDLAELLFAHGASTQLLEARGHGVYHSLNNTSLFSIFSGDVFDNFNKPTLERLFKNGANVNELEEESGMNFLQKCIAEEFSLHQSEGKIFAEIIELLISEGIDLNHQDFNNCTTLQLAIEYQQFDLALLLLDKGASPELVDRSALTKQENEQYETLLQLFQ